MSGVRFLGLSNIQIFSWAFRITASVAYQRPHTFMFVLKNFATIQSRVFIVPLDQVLRDNNMLPIICGRQEAMKSANFVTGSILILPPSLSPPRLQKCAHTRTRTKTHYQVIAF